MKKYKTIITTTNSNENCESIKNKLLSEKLSPCIQVIKNIKSSYLWEDKIVSDNEMMILIKTEFKNVELIIKEIKSLHLYDTPEILSYDFDILSEKYKKWFDVNIENK